ncbi:hypothetical protein [Vampirovibrio chlorellavorus]|uniref:hypothetical protein n=1 Tax=Vampirovibrio chlorellavorus TaxID=758823 RepID=UPI0026F2EA37|nr:hypothetical protein [Vampirovibrio chlorellavorus]
MQTNLKAPTTANPKPAAALASLATTLNGAPQAGKAYMPDIYTPIAANEWAFVWGDPHFREADGGRFDVQKEGKFNILKDKGISFTADFQKVPAKAGEIIDPKNDKRPTVTKSADLVIDGKKIHIDASGKTTVDGKELKNFDPVTLGPNSSIAKTIDGSTLIQTGEYTILFESVGKGQRLDFAVKSGGNGVGADGVNPSGLLGETFDADNIRLTKPKKNIDAYQITSNPPPAPDIKSELEKLLQQIIAMIQQLLLGFKA